MNYASGGDFLAAARQALPEGRVVTGDDEIAPWLADWRGLYRGRACALVEPRSTAEVATVVRLARQHRVPLIPQGGNTSMVGGATPDDSGDAAILSLRRLNRVRQIDTAAKLAVVEAGVILETLHERLAEQNLRFPLTLGARGSATVGGLVSTNAGGTQVLRFGTMRALVSGIEAVLPDGQVYDGLAALKKDNRGYDLTQLLIGAEGTLGVVTAATLKLVPAATDVATGWLAVRDPHAALAVLRFLEREAGEAVESFELIPARALDLVLRHIPGARAVVAGGAWHVLIDFVGTDARQGLLNLFERLFDTGLAEDGTVASSEQQAQDFWRLRDSISEAERAEGPTLAHDISVPVAAMPEFIESAGRAVEQRYPGTKVSAFGHLGDGNVHFHVGAPAAVDGAAWRRDQGPAITSMVYDLVTEAAGSISAEHGIGQMKLGELARLGEPARLAALRAIKRAFDPDNLFNPGKLVPNLASSPPAP